MAKRYNSVPLGQAGTGAAYILPESKAIKSFQDTLAYNQKMGLLNVKAQRDNQDKIAKSYQDNQIKAENGLLFNNELNKYLQKHIEKGAQYRAQGFDIYNPDPNRPDQLAASEDYMKERATLQSLMDLRKSHEQNYLNQIKQAQTGEFDEESVGALNDFYSDTGNRLYELYNTGASLPTLTKKFDWQDFMKSIEAPSIKNTRVEGNQEITTQVPNIDAIRTNIESSLRRTPAGQREIEKQIGVSVDELVGTTDPNQVAEYLNQYYQSPDGVEEALKAFPSGVVPSYNSKEYQNFLNKKTKEQLNKETKYASFIDKLTQQKAGEVNLVNSKKPNFALRDQELQEEGMQLRREAAARSRATFSRQQADRDDKNRDVNMRDKFIQGIQTGNTEDVQNLRQLAKAKGGNVGWDKKNPNVLVVEWREKVGSEYKKRSQRIDISENNMGGYAQVNEVLSNLTGKKVDLEKLQSTDPYDGGLVNLGDKSLKRSQIEYLRSEFEDDARGLGDMLKKNGFFKTDREAFKAALEILDRKGKIANVK